MKFNWLNTSLFNTSLFSIHNHFTSQKSDHNNLPKQHFSKTKFNISNLSYHRFINISKSLLKNVKLGSNWRRGLILGTVMSCAVPQLSFAACANLGTPSPTLCICSTSPDVHMGNWHVNDGTNDGSRISTQHPGVGLCNGATDTVCANTTNASIVIPGDIFYGRETGTNNYFKCTIPALGTVDLVAVAHNPSPTTPTTPTSGSIGNWTWIVSLGSILLLLISTGIINRKQQTMK